MKINQLLLGKAFVWSMKAGAMTALEAAISQACFIVIAVAGCSAAVLIDAVCQPQ